MWKFSKILFYFLVHKVKKNRKDYHFPSKMVSSGDTLNMYGKKMHNLNLPRVDSQNLYFDFYLFRRVWVRMQCLCYTITKISQLLAGYMLLSKGYLFPRYRKNLHVRGLLFNNLT